MRVRAATGEIDWALIDEPLCDAFFETTTDRAMGHPFNLAFARRTPLGALDDLAAAVPGLTPTGFVFHMSRCGSTLVAQMLSRLSASVVLSEPQPLDGLLRMRGRVDDAILIRWFRGLMSALGQPRRGEERLFIKFHAWHVLELPFIARAFPNVPWIFVFREPRAVLHSQARTPGAEVLLGTLDPSWLGVDHAAVCSVPPTELSARVIAAFCDAALRHQGLGRSAFVDYATLPESVIFELLPFFGIRVEDAEVERMLSIARLDAKSAGAFRVRSGERDPTGEIERLARDWLDAPCAELRATALR